MLAVGCGAARPAISPSDAERARASVATVLDDWHAAAAASDEARYFDHLAEDAVFLGTDATERWTKRRFRAYAHPHFDRGNGWAFRSIRREITVDPGGRLAWFDEDLATENLGPARGSGVLRRGDDGRWRIVQYNLALTIPNERFQRVREVLERPAEP
jgi:ketosteroid isomerase-like protein